MSIERRRWYRWSLRTLFAVVTVFAVWLGWHMKIVHQRRAYLDGLKSRGLSYELVSESESAYRDVGSDYMSYYELPGPVSIPFWRRWLGDDAAIRISVGDVATEADEARRLFPEVGVVGDWRSECL